MGDDRSIERVLITGISGSAGSYLAEYLISDHPEVEVHGITRWRSTASSNLDRIADQVTVHEADLVDLSSVFCVLQEVRPDAIFHLAAHANVPASYITPSTVLTNNIIGTSNLLEGVRLTQLDPIIQLCSSAEVYGQVDPKHIPITEETPLQPVSPYAVSKVTQDLMGLAYFVTYGMRIIRTRMFAYLNPRRVDLFATAFAKQVAWIERGLQKELVHGNLNSVRTIIDMRDGLKAYWAAILHCQPGEAYNIGGPTTMSVGEFLERLIALSDVPIPTRIDPSLLRSVDVELQIASVDKFMKATGWQPQISFEESLDELLSYWRQRADEEVRLSQTADSPTA